MTKLREFSGDDEKEVLVTEGNQSRIEQIGKGVRKAVYCHPASLTYMQSTS